LKKLEKLQNILKNELEKLEKGSKKFWKNETFFTFEKTFQKLKKHLKKLENF